MSGTTRAAAKTTEAKKDNSVSQQRKTEPPQPMRSPADRIKFLQRTIGNQRVQGLLRSGALQAKLKISSPGDRYEQEADRVAERVVASKPMQAPHEGKAQVQRKSISDAPVADNFVQNLGPGQPLDTATRAFFERRFGYDFSGVRVHTDARAVESARAVNARAFTVGRDVVFGEGEYGEGVSGQRLMAHELTHVVQQKSRDGMKQLIQRQKVENKSPDKVHRFKINNIEKFFNEFNHSFKTISGKESKFSISDVKFFKPEEFIEQSAVKSHPSYSDAKHQAREICTSTQESIIEGCKNNNNVNICIRKLKQEQENGCSDGEPKQSLIAKKIDILGLTTTLAEPSLVMIGASENQNLETIIHEEVHRARGKTWSDRSKIGRFTHTINKELILYIRRRLDEGTTQIITNEIKDEMKKKGWFKDSNSDFYNNEIIFVKKILDDHKKDIIFLKEAYFGEHSDEKVQDLQLWQ